MKYYIYQKVGEFGSEIKIATVEDKTSYTVTGLQPNKTYYFSVSADNGLHESKHSEALKVTTSSISVSSITLTIDKTALEVGGTAQITVDVNPEDQTEGQTMLSSSNLSVAKLTGNTLTAVGAGETSISATIGTVTSNILRIKVYEALVTPSNLRATGTTTTETTLEWS